MRLGEIRNILKEVLSENYTLEIKHKAIYGGQAQQVDNFKQLIEALDVMSKQRWNEADYSHIETMKKEYGLEEEAVVLSVDEFNQLNSYINSVNSKVPLYYAVIESLVKKQDERAINIRLPKGLRSLEDLNVLNKRLSDVLKLFNVDGQFEFLGFDKGTEWYELVVKGVLSHAFFISCLKITQEYLKVRTEYFKSQEAKMSYEASLKDKEEFSEKGFETFREKWLKLFIKKEVKNAVDKIGTNGQTKPELNSQLVKATTKLVKELGEGTEFHLSLNPPVYAKEQSGKLRIDYEKIKATLPKKENKPKQLGEGKKKKNAKN